MLIPHSHPVFDSSFTQATTQIVQSGQLAQGETTTKLEQRISQSLGVQHTLAVDSGTSALMLAIRALTNHKPLARVGIPTYACASLLFAVKNAGATPVFLDCTDDLTLNAEHVFSAAKTLDVLVLVHPFGMVEPLVKATFACPVIEDIAQTVGATLGGQQVGTFADVCIGSHYATKPWGGAYGGFISSPDVSLIDKCKTMTNPDAADLNAAYVGHHQLSNIHAALAVERINQADDERKHRQAWAQKYDILFAQTSASPIKSCTQSVANDFRYLVRTALDADIIIQTLRNMGVGASKPVQQPLHHSDSTIQCPTADDAWQHCVSLPLLADMCDAEFQQIEQGIQTCFPS